MSLTAFVLAALPPPPARVLEVGCGAGKLARAVDAAGYGVLAIDPEAPEGPIFQRTTLEELDQVGPFDAAIASYSPVPSTRSSGSFARTVSTPTSLEASGRRGR